MATLMETAILSDAVYDDALSGGESALALGIGWKKVLCFPDARRGQTRLPLLPLGYFACLFESVKHPGEFVYAIRGSEKPTSFAGLADWFNNLFIALGTAPPQSAVALRSLGAIREQTGGRPFVVTGHSLGGGLAAIVGAVEAMPTVTFNAPRIGPLAEPLAQVILNCRGKPVRLLSIRSRFDPASRLTGSYRFSKEIVLEVPAPWYRVAEQHAIKVLIEELRKHPVANRELLQLL